MQGNPDKEEIIQISFKIPKSGLNVLNYLALSLDVSRQTILDEILKNEIKNAYLDFTNQFQMNKQNRSDHFEMVCSGILKKEQDNA